MAQNPFNTKKQAIVSQKDFNLIWRIVKSNWWVPLLVVPIFYAIGTFYIYKITPIYYASTEFLLQPNDEYYKNNVLSDASFVNYSAYIDNSNEIRILNSYDLSNKIVKRVRDEIQISYYIVGKVRTTEYFRNMPFRIKMETVNSAFYERLFDFQVLDSDSYEISYEIAGEKKVIPGKFNVQLSNPDFPLKLEWAENFSPKSAGTLRDILYQFKIHSESYLVANIRQNLKITNPDLTRILKVDLKDVIPERAVLVLDTLNAVYQDSKLESKYELNQRTIEYIDRQLEEISFSLKSIEDTMQTYKEKKHIINLDWQQQDFLGKISVYDNQRSQLQLQLGALDDLQRYIVEDKDPSFLPPSVYVFEKSGFLMTAAQDLSARQLELTKATQAAKEANPQIVDLRSSIRKTRQDLLIYINNTREATKKQIANLNDEILSYINEAKLIPAKQRDVLNIQRKAAVSEQLYNFLLEKKASTKIARASITPDVKIVEAPRIAGIDSPDKTKLEQQFISIGLVLSLVIVFIRAAYFSKIRTVEHLKDLTDLPLVGVLPYVKAKESEGLIVDTEPNSTIAEAFRNMRTNLQYSNIDVAAKTYLVTSFLPGEGKTFTSSNLAALLAKSGNKTLLVELDLHKPKVYKRFGIQAPPKGITTYVTGQSTFDEIITPTYIPNLSCLYAGPVPPNPSDFVLSEKLKELLLMAKKKFDFVIIDTPPAGLLSDSMYLIQFTDASIFVLNTKTSSKRVITFLESIIQTNKLSNVLLILNGVVRSGRRYYYEGYGYSYGYGYGYGYGKGKGY